MSRLQERYRARFVATRPNPASDPAAESELASQPFCNPLFLAGSDEHHAGSVRLICISDTHQAHNLIPPLPAGDVLLHAGDFTCFGSESEVLEFARWFARQPQRHKVVIAGNHDVCLDTERTLAAGAPTDDVKRRFVDIVNAGGGVYLEDQAAEVAGLRIWGSPWQPFFGDGAFNLGRGRPCLEKWSLIDAGVDVLVTHGPPFGRGDLCHDGRRAGCLDLLYQVQTRIRPKIHVFGHIHEDRGVSSDGITDFVNATTCDVLYRPIHPPIVVDLPHTPRRI